MRSGCTLKGETMNFPWSKPTMFGNEKGLVLEALESTWISGGPFVDRLEREFSELLGVSEAIAVSNGTTALHLANLGLNIGPDDEVIFPAFSFVAAYNMTIAVGAKPIFADVNIDTWLLDPDQIEPLITPRTKAIVPVHLYGNVADMSAICEIADAHGVSVIEDSAEAAFSCYKGRYAGTIGDVGTFSFHATKTITTGEGGMVVTNDREMADRMRVLRDHGMRKDKRYWHDVVGYNFRMTNMQAALGCAQLQHLDTIRSERARIHETYRKYLAAISQVRPQKFLNSCEPVMWAMAVKLDDSISDLSNVERRRNTIIEAMRVKGIETRPGFYSASALPAYECCPMPVADAISASVISLPTYIGLKEDDIRLICAVFSEAITQSL